MSLYAQALLDTHDELLIDLFAGGGGASSGIEQALGRMVDVAINHDASAVSLHEANHPQTQHHQADVFEVCPKLVTQGRPVGLLWASPDCTFHSKARGGKPIRSKVKKRRALAWVVTRWAGQVRPRVIMLENVEEFAQWGPLVGGLDNLRPCPKRRGRTFRKWVKSLTDLGYTVEWRELRACDYGAPTIRKRLFLIARCDGQPIVWPEATHGPGRKPYRTAAECIDWSIPMLSIFATKDEAKAFGKEHGQGTPIRPLADATHRRIARGVMRYVVNNPKPFLVKLAHGEESNGKKRWGRTDRGLDQPLGSVTASNGDALVSPIIGGVGGRAGQSPERPGDKPLGTITGKGDAAVFAPMIAPITHHGDRRCPSADEPLATITAAKRGELSLVAASLGTYYGEKGPCSQRVNDLGGPLHTQTTENRHALVASFLTQNNGGFNQQDGRAVTEPVSTVLCNSRGHHGLIAATLIEQHGTAHAEDIEKPLQTISAGGNHHGLVAAHVQRDFGQSVGSECDSPLGTVTAGSNGHAGLVASFLSKFYGQGTGQGLDEPTHTVPTVDRFGLVTVPVNGEEMVISDIAMRMLQPKELYLAQGFRPSYIIDRGSDGRMLTKTEQVRMCGNSVSPNIAQALVKANAADLVARPRKEVA